jgi:autotransporter-associated beta strand protein
LTVLGNTSNSQQFNGLTVNQGSSAIVLTATSGNALLLSLGSITRNAVGGTVDFTLPSGGTSTMNGITTTTPNNSTGILGAYATVGGTDWACSAGTNGTAGNITAYSSYTGGDLGSLGSGSALNVSPSGTQSPVTSARSFNTLNLTYGEGATMTGSGSLTLLGSGVIGNTVGTISGGTLAGSASGELIVITPANLTIGSVIANNGGATALTKAGSATLILAGNNTYSGVTTIGAGILQVGAGGSSGALGSGPVVDNNSALVFSLSSATTYGGAISGVGVVTQDGNGELVLSGSNDYGGGTTVSAGTLCLASPNALLEGTSLTIGQEQTLNLDLMASEAPAESPILVAPPTALPSVVAVPEPPALVLLAVALGAWCGRRWQNGRRRLRRPHPPIGEWQGHFAATALTALSCLSCHRNEFRSN